LVRGAILPAGWAPTLENATGRYGQYDEENLRITP